MNKKKFALGGILVVLFLLAGPGCELGTNPLLFDGSPVTVSFRVDEPSATILADSTSKDLEDVKNIDKDIDSVKVFNITVQIDSITGGTDSSTTLTGTVTLDHAYTLFTLDTVALSEFVTERSIFDNSLGNKFAYNSAGVNYLLDLIKNKPNPLPTVWIAVYGRADKSPLHFRVRLRLYTQIYTTP